ncbi:hypothetical protein ABE85_16490 [Mitsuaria sp. 7]|nr:hypothetical protein ABE85_16490 [Mitsuaria sp. 7]
MSSADGASLVQLQPDRLYVNWRKMEDSQEYPRFEAVRDRYLRIREQFNLFLKELSGDELSPAGYELTYTNPFLSANGWRSFADLPNFFKPWAWDKADFGSAPKSLRLNVEMELPGDCGKLVLNISPAIRKVTNEPAMRVDLTAQAEATVAARTSLAEWAETAHVAIVETFVKISTAEKLAEWGHWEEHGK